MLKGVYLAEQAYRNDTNSYACTESVLVNIAGVEYGQPKYYNKPQLPPEDCNSVRFLIKMISRNATRTLSTPVFDTWSINHEGTVVHWTDGTW